MHKYGTEPRSKWRGNEKPVVVEGEENPEAGRQLDTQPPRSLRHSHRARREGPEARPSDLGAVAVVVIAVAEVVVMTGVEMTVVAVMVVVVTIGLRR
jgi:hypothetical protein